MSMAAALGRLLRLGHFETTCSSTRAAFVHPFRTAATAAVPGEVAAAESDVTSAVSAGNGNGTAVLMLNMGGPSTPDETGPFLHRLFNDGDIIQLGGGLFQKLLGTFIAKRRTPKVQAQYEQIGGSPIRMWTEHQGQKMCEILDKTNPDTAPHKPYIAFRYAHPLTEEALQQMQDDKMERVVAFSQFPQWSCTTTGSSMNELWRQIKEKKLESTFKWSLIDRWPLHSGFIDAVTDRIMTGLEQFDEADRHKVVILFSAHSVPMQVVEKGDHYVPEVCGSVKAIMDELTTQMRNGNPDGPIPRHILAWQSKVGFLPWMVPSTTKVIEGLGKRNSKHVLVVPVAFTSDHIETLYEIGMEYAEEAEEVGITHFKWTEGLNGSEVFIKAQADIVADHLKSGKPYSPQYKMKCIGCEKPNCRQIVNPAF